MGNKICFKGTPTGPVQEDSVNANESVKFYCDEKFRIIFDRVAVGYIESNPSVGWFAPAKEDPGEFESVELRKGEWVVKVKFGNIPKEGLKYTVRLDASGLALDPRVVPPR